MKVIVFSCGKEEYAVPVERVDAIEKAEHITPIPHLPEYLVGFSKIRGELRPILDCERILYQRNADLSTAKVIVIQSDELIFGLMVADAKEILDIEESALKQVGLVNYAKTQFFEAVANLDDRLITLISPDVLVDTLEGIKDIKAYLQYLKDEEVQI